ncbi:MAG: hypothetical protein ACREEM_39520 [Blastocatellia bacterium]
MSFSAHYTYSNNISFNLAELHSLSAPQDGANIRAERGPTLFDVRHRFISDFVYELPFARFVSSPARWQTLLASGWQLAGIFTTESGSPFSIASSSSIIGQRADYVGGGYYGDRVTDPLQYLNKAAFAQVPLVASTRAAIRPGTLGRNAVRGPGFWNLDLALSKNLALTERTRLQLRADMFNATNHVAFSGVQTNITANNFGRFTSTRSARVVQLNARFTF